MQSFGTLGDLYRAVNDGLADAENREREMCAKIAEDMGNAEIAAAIRARSKTPSAERQAAMAKSGGGLMRGLGAPGL